MDTDQDIFAQALADNPPAEQPEQTAETGAEQPREQPESPAEPVRDEKGRFAPRQQESTPAATAQPEQPAQKPEADHRVPLRELLDERERRQNFEREIAEERRQREALQRRLVEIEKASQPKAPPPDIFENPTGFVESVEERMERRFREQEANFSLRLAHRQYRQEFESAYESLIKAGSSGDRMAVQSVLSSPDPGEALVKWHRQRTLVEKTGGDLDGFLKKREEELLDDPAFMAKVAEKLKAKSSTVQPGARPAVQLPPSLSRVAAAAPQLADGDDDMSDQAIFANAFKR